MNKYLPAPCFLVQQPLLPIPLDICSFLRVFASSREFRFVPHAKPRRARRIVDEVTRKEGEAASLWFEKVLGS